MSRTHEIFKGKLRNIILEKYKKLKISSSIPDTPSYWTCFSYAGYPPNDLHCTHKFLGEQSSENISKITSILDNYFSKNKFISFTPHFNLTSFFGKNKEVKVLKLSKFEKELFIPKLREQLDIFNKDTFPEYTPHVTTFKDSVYLPFTHYCFMFGDEIVKKY